MNESSPIKVAYVLKRYPRFSETFIVNEILALEKQGVEITILALKPATEGVFHECLARVKAKVIYLPSLSQSPSKFVATLNRHIERYGIDAIGALLDQDTADLEHGLRAAEYAYNLGVDVIHAHFATSATSIARIASLLTGIPFSFTAHAKDIFHEDVDINSLNERLADAARIFTVSDFNVAHLNRIAPHCEGKLRRIYNGMPLDTLPIRGARATRHRVLTVGRLIEKKGVADLLRAIAILSSTFPDIRCDVIGDGPLSNSLACLSCELGLSDQVTFHGILPQQTVHRFMMEADAFVAPCVVSEDGDRDGLPTVLLEALAIGTPCVSTLVTGIPEVIKHHETGLLVEERNPRAIAEACASLFTDMGLALSLATAGRSLIEAEFDIDVNTQQLASEWKEIAVQTSSEQSA